MRANIASTGGGSGQSLAAAMIVMAILVLSLGAMVVTVRLPNYHLQLFLLLLLLLPAILLAFANSRYLLPYVVFVWAIAAELRRITDWIVGEYQPMALMIIAPFVVSLVLLIPIIRFPIPLSPNLRKAAFFFTVALVHGTIMGVTRNGFAFFFDFANYVLPMLLVVYATTRRPDVAERDAWIASLSTIACLVAIYGWIQYLTMPAWDAFWMINSKMRSIGYPYPMRFRVFSTLNAPAPAASLLAAALGPMLLQRRWRGVFGWVGVVLVASVLGITLVRTAWLMLVVFLIVYILATPLRQSWRAITAVVVAGMTIIMLIPFLPGNRAITSRFQSFSSLNKDESYRSRVQLMGQFFSDIGSNPLGNGIGGAGLSVQKFAGEKMAHLNMDNGLYLIYLSFGLFGSLSFFMGLWMVVVALRDSARQFPKMKDHAHLARAMIAASIAGLMSGNFFLGVGGFLLWFFVGCATGAAAPAVPVQVARRLGRVSPSPSAQSSRGHSLS